jgi:hypothetical protein
MDKKTNIIGELKNQVTESLKTEIFLMREVLANMQQEEIAITLLDKHSLNKTLQDRFPLIEKLSTLRTNRIETCKNIQQLSCKGSDGKILPMEQIFPSITEDGMEVDFLSDQITTLIEKINSQNTKNSLLMEKYDALGTNRSSPSSIRPNTYSELKAKNYSVTVAVLSKKNT